MASENNSATLTTSMRSEERFNGIVSVTNHLGYFRIFYPFVRRFRQQRMRTARNDFLASRLAERMGRLGQGPRRIAHVVNKNHVAPLYLTDNVHHFGFVLPGAALVDDRKVGIEALGVRPRHLDRTHIRSYNHDIVELQLPEIAR